MHVQKANPPAGTVRLRCVSRYRTPALQVGPGDIISDLSHERAQFLLDDAPGCFVDADETERHEPPADDEGEIETKAPRRPARDKQIKEPGERK